MCLSSGKHSEPSFFTNWTAPYVKKLSTIASCVEISVLPLSLASPRSPFALCCYPVLPTSSTRVLHGYSNGTESQAFAISACHAAVFQLWAHVNLLTLSARQFASVVNFIKPLTLSAYWAVNCVN